MHTNQARQALRMYIVGWTRREARPIFGLRVGGSDVRIAYHTQTQRRPSFGLRVFRCSDGWLAYYYLELVEDLHPLLRLLLVRRLFFFWGGRWIDKWMRD